MNTSKGYIIPVILVFLLLILAGFFTFAQKPAVLPITQPVVVPVQIQATTTSTTTATTTELPQDTPIEGGSTSANPGQNSRTQCFQNEDCFNGQVCYFKPGGTIGSCTSL